MVFLRVRIITLGASGAPVTMPSSVGSADMVISASIAPESSSCPFEQALVQTFQHFAGAGDGIFRPLDLHAVAARRDIDAQPVFDLHQVGIELPEQCAKDGCFLELDLGAGAAGQFGAERGRFVGPGWFAGHRCRRRVPFSGPGAALIRKIGHRRR
jgi:hypothetical protein